MKKVFYLSCSALWMLLLMVQHYRGQSFLLEDLVLVVSIMVFLGLNPFEVYAKMIEGATGTAYRFQETISKTMPLVILSLGIAVAFKMKFWNIGAEGPFYMGAFGAAWVAFSFPEAPAVLLIPRMLLAGFLCGGRWAKMCIRDRSG